MTPPPPRAARGLAWVTYANAFLVGAVVMGFEMLASRYLYPYFGGTIVTWAALISSVLLALMIGYFAGGLVADRAPSALVLALLQALAGLYLALVPASATPVMLWLWERLGDGPTGSLAASLALLLVPLSLMGTVSPFAVKLLLLTTQATGRIAGRVYAVATLGSICGTLGVTFWLVPAMGSRAITYLLAALMALAALALLPCHRASRERLRQVGAPD